MNRNIFNIYYWYIIYYINIINIYTHGKYNIYIHIHVYMYLCEQIHSRGVLLPI